MLRNADRLHTTVSSGRRSHQRIGTAIRHSSDCGACNKFHGGGSSVRSTIVAVANRGSRGGEHRLSARDTSDVLGFATQVVTGEFGGVQDALEALMRLIPCAVVEYVAEVRFADEPGPPIGVANFRTFPVIEFALLEGDDALENDRTDPIRRHRDVTGSLSAVRLSDLVGDPVDYWSRLDVVAFGEHLWMQYGARLPYLLTMRIPRPCRRPAAVSFVRDGRDFTARDVGLLDALEPFLRLLDSSPRPVSAPSDHQLTPREREILDLVSDGSTNIEIARELGISPTTVRSHLEHIFTKLDVSTRTAALAKTGRCRRTA